MARIGPGLYSEIGRQARDLLYRDYQTDQKFTLSTVTADGIAITTSGTRKIDDNIIGEIQSRLMANKNVTVDVKALAVDAVEINPIVNLLSVFGTKALAVGADVSLDTATGNFTKYNAGVNVTLTDAVASLILYLVDDA